MRHDSAMESARNVAPAALLMSLERRSYCWIVRRFTPDFFAQFTLGDPAVLPSALKADRQGFATDRPIQGINGSIFGDFVKDRVKPKDFPHGKRLPDVLERPSSVPLETGCDPASPVFGGTGVFRPRVRIIVRDARFPQDFQNKFCSGHPRNVFGISSFKLRGYT